MTTAGNPAFTGRRYEIDHRRMLVATMMLAHRTPTQMVEELARMNPPIHTSRQAVNDDVKQIRRQWADRSNDAYNTHVAEEVAKLDALERTFMPMAMNKDYKAAERCMAIFDRRARLLGLDRPVKIDAHFSVTEYQSKLDKDLEELVEMVKAQPGPAAVPTE